MTTKVDPIVKTVIEKNQWNAAPGRNLYSERVACSALWAEESY